MKWLLSLILVLLAVGTLRTVGCGDEDPCGGCDDGNPCTRDVCDRYNTSGTISCDPDDYDYRCVYPSVPDGTSCGGGNVCVGGVCGENLCADCEDDGDECTRDCDYATGSCDYLPIREGAACDTGQHSGICISGVCTACEELDCDDGNLCTHDSCNLERGGCVNEPIICPGTNQCAQGVCNPATGECTNPPMDGEPCWGNSVWGWLALCEGDTCVGQCDVESTELYPCPVTPPATDEKTYVCCPWDDREIRRPYCIEEGVCEVERIERRCESECPATSANPARTDYCINYTKGDCELVDYCFEECWSTRWECMTNGECS